MKNLRKLYAILLCLSLLVCLPMTASAADDAAADEEKIEWHISDDQNTLTYGDEVYTRVSLPAQNWLRPHTFYEYDQQIETDDPVVDCIGRPASYPSEELVLNPDMVLIYDYIASYAKARVYVKGEALQSISDFAAGQYEAYELAEGFYYSADIDGQMIQSWRTQAPDVSVNATELGELNYYYVLGYDSTLTLAHVIGAVFVRDGEYLFVHYDSLDNNYFDSNGQLSFRSGNVPALRIEGADATAVSEAIDNSADFEPNVIYEPVEPLDATLSIIFFLLLGSPLLYLLPIGLGVLGIVMRCSKRTTNKARWTPVIILSAVWLVLAVLTGALLLIPTFFL